MNIQLTAANALMSKCDIKLIFPPPRETRLNSQTTQPLLGIYHECQPSNCIHHHPTDCNIKRIKSLTQTALERPIKTPSKEGRGGAGQGRVGQGRAGGGAGQGGAGAGQGGAGGVGQGAVGRVGMEVFAD